MSNPVKAFAVFFPVWFALGLGSFLFFTFGKDVAKKKRLFPRLAIGSGVLFGGFIAWMAPRPMALLSAPFIALIVWLNLRMTRFCDSCGKMVINHQWWTPMNYCSRCGAKLPAK